MNLNPKTRFSNRVENYKKYRPGYPTEIFELLRDKCGLKPESTVADIGSGTGIFSKFLMDNGNPVYAVEPNLEMRKQAENDLGSNPHFHSIAGSAEATTLPDNSIDIITSAQAFHWFDRLKTKQEFHRILKPAGHIILIWNERITGPAPFLQAYEDLLVTFATDYGQVDHRLIDEKVLTEFFSPVTYTTASFAISQEFDLHALKGRLLSSSYAPNPDHPNHKPMMTELERIFNAYHESGKVRFEYRTQVYFGQLS